MPSLSMFFFFNNTATNEIYTLSLHDALPISAPRPRARCRDGCRSPRRIPAARTRSEEHTSELQSLRHLVCRLLLEKKKTNMKRYDENHSRHCRVFFHSVYSRSRR